mgnify:FL=1|jgi:hypothetical protein|tara:strand:- start:4060 stop:4566 length:507 start_codon:yes stop_codon:yes gene_type:complete
MKNYALIAFASLLFFSCADQQDLTLFNTNKAIAQKVVESYTSPTNFEQFKSMLDEKIEHQSPMYGAGVVGYDQVLEQANYYMSNFSDVTFDDAVWLPGVNNETLKADGSVRVYGTWNGVSKATGKSFSVDSYHYFEIKDSKVMLSGDFFDATGMMMAVSADPEVEEAE